MHFAVSNADKRGDPAIAVYRVNRSVVDGLRLLSVQNYNFDQEDSSSEVSSEIGWW
jgi:hypothetical protein